MARLEKIDVRVEPGLKEQAEGLYSSLGMTLNEAINVFLHKSIAEGGLPFDVRQQQYNTQAPIASSEPEASAPQASEPQSNVPQNDEPQTGAPQN